MTEQKVILISGGSRGLGAALVERLLAQGHILATFSRSRTPFVDQMKAHAQFGERFRYAPIDATDAKAVRTFVTELYNTHQRLDVLINNAAVAYDGTLATFPDEKIERLIQTNLTSTLLLTKSCVRYMLLRSQGAIINISSIIGLRGYAGLAAYSASKAGLIGMTRSLARELGSKHIRVNAIAPGYLDTEMSSTLAPEQKQQIIRRTPLGRLGTAADVAGLVEFLVSDAASFITGEAITVDGGITC